MITKSHIFLTQDISTLLGAAWSHVCPASVHSRLRLLRAALRLAVRDEIWLLGAGWGVHFSSQVSCQCKLGQIPPPDVRDQTSQATSWSQKLSLISYPVNYQRRKNTTASVLLSSLFNWGYWIVAGLLWVSLLGFFLLDILFRCF